MINDFTISLPATLTPQPWITAGCLISLIAGISWLYLVSTQELELRSARFQLRLFVSGIVVLGAISLALLKGVVPQPDKGGRVQALEFLAELEDDVEQGEGLVVGRPPGPCRLNPPGDGGLQLGVFSERGAGGG